MPSCVSLSCICLGRGFSSLRQQVVNDLRVKGNVSGCFPVYHFLSFNFSKRWTLRCKVGGGELFLHLSVVKETFLQLKFNCVRFLFTFCTFQGSKTVQTPFPTHFSHSVIFPFPFNILLTYWAQTLGVAE